MALGEYIFFPCDEGAGTTLTSTGNGAAVLSLTECGAELSGIISVI
jgi:hypothetical protein